jgi:hypothetical protein
MAWASCTNTAPPAVSAAPLGWRRNSSKPSSFFQQADLVAQRRLLHVQALGGAREMLLFGHHQEIAQVSQFHGSMISHLL